MWERLKEVMLVERIEARSTAIAKAGHIMHLPCNAVKARQQATSHRQILAVKCSYQRGPGNSRENKAQHLRAQSLEPGLW